MTRELGCDMSGGCAVAGKIVEHGISLHRPGVGIALAHDRAGAGFVQRRRKLAVPGSPVIIRASRPWPNPATVQLVSARANSVT